MYKIEKKDYGYKLTFGGLMNVYEMKLWLDESRKNLVEAPKEFGIIVDMRTLNTLSADAQLFMQEGQCLYKEKGMVRSIVIHDSCLNEMQFKRIAQVTGIYKWERYINASSVNDWEETGINWVDNGIDPDIYVTQPEIYEIDPDI